ncbi:PREDICTED: COMM domain-containing protein 8-like [Amphimedon queenslandica]|uniref:COMM domain-containing protein n=1 Tax=Amphimedon queenslandica TaxID=400682 RepID=A0A1X7V0K2_AMPQE|nr:PREDICTED: COMM domain-containing protein 8-like [Amphimedon queenslandica]|eukprot:XP_003386057.1 PREDICTED: COMM domain-containing protein 8-like [Amphimedon queenslandica]
MATDLELLQKLEPNDSRKFVHAAINGLCEKDGLHYEEYSNSLSLSEYSKLKQSLISTIRQTARQGTDKKDFLDSLVKLGAPQDVGGVIAESLWVRRDEIRAQFIRDSASFSHSSLGDYDIRTKLVLSSDKLGSIQEPLLSLDLRLHEGGKERVESLELSKDELDKLVTSLEAANKVVLQLRT